MTAVADFTTQLAALLEGVSEGTRDYYQSAISKATEKFLRQFFHSLQLYINKLPKSLASDQVGPSSLGYRRTVPLDDQWIKRKGRVLYGRKDARYPRLWRGISSSRGRESLVDLLAQLGSDQRVGPRLMESLGGVQLKPRMLGATALKGGLESRNGKVYNPGTKRYVSWAQAVNPVVDAKLRLAAAQRGASFTPTGRVAIPGRRGSVSQQRALAEGYLSIGYTVSFLSKIDSFLWGRADHDELARILTSAGLIESRAGKKFSGLLADGHAILTPYFGSLISAPGSDKSGLQSFIEKELGGV